MQKSCDRHEYFLLAVIMRQMIARGHACVEGEDALVRRAEIYSKISMKFLDGSALYTMHDNACSYADRHVWVERRLARTRRTSGEISHYAFLSQAAVIILHIAGGGVPRLPLPIFPARQKGTAGNLAVPAIRVRVCIRSP